MAARRVVITGMGAVTPFGVTTDCFWDGLVEGRSGIRPVSLFDVSEYSVRIGGEVPQFDATEFVDRRIVKRLDRYAQFAYVASDEAVRASNLDVSREDPYRMATIFGSGIGGINELEQQHTRLTEKGPSKVSAFTIPKLMLNAASGNLSIRYGAKGNSIGIASACASATHAMGEALRHIQTGKAEIVFTGGAEAALTPLAGWRSYQPPFQASSAIMAAFTPSRKTWLWREVLAEPHQGAMRSTISGNMDPQWKACIAPMEKPHTRAMRSIPNTSDRSRC